MLIQENTNFSAKAIAACDKSAIMRHGKIVISKETPIRFVPTIQFLDKPNPMYIADGNPSSVVES